MRNHRRFLLAVRAFGKIGAISLALFFLSARYAAPSFGQVLPLPSYNIDIKQTSVSGLSSGAYMAVQFDVAFSSISKGAGVIAGGPYYCAMGDLTTAQNRCMAANSTINVGQLIQITESNASAGSIDATSNLPSHRIWLFSGTVDATVKQPVMNDLQKYYQHYAGNNNVFYKKDIAAGHAFPTDAFGNPCSATTDPFINNCGYDAAGELLKWIYGDLNLPGSGGARGAFFEFDQSQFIRDPNSHSMANSGWVYVPESCQKGAACRLHIAFHGCKQYPGYMYFGGGGMVRFGRTFVDNTGYNRWADTNNIVVLYPQASNGSKNPLGCWDWWGYDDPNYAKKNGRQMAAVKAMADRIASPALPAPQGLSRGEVTETSAELTWNAVAQAAGYHVYRNGSKATANPVTSTRHSDSGLAPGTSYEYYVRAVDASGREGAPSAGIVVKTPGTPPAVPAPAALTVGNVSASSVALSWTGVPDIAGYNVFFRSSAAGSQYVKANASLIKPTSYTVGGLQPGTGYQFVVRSENSEGASSAASNEVSVTTTDATRCFTASNFAHVQAGRAYASAGYAHAKGSNARMGLNNIFLITGLKQTGPDFYVIDNLTCP